jgi:hypothetical protein
MESRSPELEKTDVSRLKAAGWKPPTPFSVKSANGKMDVYGIMFTPTNLDPNRKYPVVDYIYPGPQSGSVGSWGFSAARGDHQALAELGFVVVLIEGTGNPNRSKSFHDAYWPDMSTNTLPDQIAGIVNYHSAILISIQTKLVSGDIQAVALQLQLLCFVTLIFSKLVFLNQAIMIIVIMKMIGANAISVC